jgi:hypothetical protein
MAKNRKGAAPSPRLEALLRVGDMGSARAEARRVLADPGAGDADREAAAAALRRASPERAAAIAAAAGFAFFLAVALLGILRHR